MTTKFKLSTITPAGEFTRVATRPYSHTVVWACPRAMAAYRSEVQTGSGVHARWIKDRGYGVTWHGSEQAAKKSAAGGYKWAPQTSTLVGVFPVTTTN